MRRILIPLIFGLAGAAILVSLGVWQVQRLAWKEGVLAQIQARISGEPIELPDTLDPEQHRYAPVQLAGSVGEAELHVLTSRKRVGAGYLVVSPFTLEDGRRILLDRGFVRSEKRGEVRPNGPTKITGNLNWPDDRTSSTPANDLVDNTWFARDVVEMADALKTEPVMVILAASETDLGTTPLPVDTSAIPNDHLNYAITWFSLAAIWLVMTAFLIIRILKKDAP